MEGLWHGPLLGRCNNLKDPPSASCKLQTTEISGDVKKASCL